MDGVVVMKDKADYSEWSRGFVQDFVHRRRDMCDLLQSVRLAQSKDYGSDSRREIQALLR